MTVIEPPKGPGSFVSRWRTEGPVDSDILAMWKEELDWPSWLSLAEAALFMDAPELLDAMASKSSGASMNRAASANDNHEGQSSSSFHMARISLSTGPSVRHRETKLPGPLGGSMTVMVPPRFLGREPRHQ